MSIKDPDYIYVMTNPSFPDNEVKIGYASDVEARRKALHGTGIPRPFEIKYKRQVHNAYHLEQAVHQRLKNYRINDGREFFSCGVSMAVSTIEELMTDYGISPAEAFDASLAKIQEVDENAYDAGYAAFEDYFRIHGTYYYDNSMISFEARVANCGKGRSFSDFARGWRQSALDEKGFSERRAQAKKRDEDAKHAEIVRKDKIKSAAFDEGVNAASKSAIWKKHNAPDEATPDVKDAFNRGVKEYKSYTSTNAIIGVVGIMLMLASFATGSKELFILFIVIGLGSILFRNKF